MHISPATPPSAATQVNTAAVAAAQQRANHDGDGKTGAAALNDGDAAATAAQQVKTQQPVNVKA